MLVAIDGCSGSARGRIVFEAKNSRVAKKVALAELDEAMAQRDAAYGVWVVPSEEQLPARTQPLREINGDKLFVVYDPDEGGRLALQVAYSLARARVLMARGDAEGLDASAVRAEVERALGALEEGRRIRQQLTHAANGVEAAREILDAMERRVKAHLAQVDQMLAEAAPPPTTATPKRRGLKPANFPVRRRVVVGMRSFLLATATIAAALLISATGTRPEAAQGRLGHAQGVGRPGHVLDPGHADRQGQGRQGRRRRHARAPRRRRHGVRRPPAPRRPTATATTRSPSARPRAPCSARRPPRRRPPRAPTPRSRSPRSSA